MPQIYFKLSPFGKSVMGSSAMIRKLEQEIRRAIVETWEVPNDDIACSVHYLSYTRSEANLQIEIRYTAGTDEYKQGAPFDPTIEEQKELISKIKAIFQDFCSGINSSITASVWTKPSYNSVFEML